MCPQWDKWVCEISFHSLESGHKYLTCPTPSRSLKKHSQGIIFKPSLCNNAILIILFSLKEFLKPKVTKDL